MSKIFTLLSLLLISGFSINSCAGRISTELPPASPSEKPTADLPIPSPPVTGNPNSSLPTDGNYISLNILTYNVWGLPNPITKDLKERMTKLGTALNGFDIVNLQETFSDYSDDFIFKKSDYITRVRWDNSSFLALGSGLGTMSKFPVKKRDFRKFSECKTFDCNSNKGILFLRVNVPNLGDIDIYNTHYQAEDKYEDIRISDNKLLQSFIKANDVGNLTIMTGDFNFPLSDNTDSTSKAYTDLKNRLSFIDTFRVANPKDVGFSHNSQINTYAGKAQPKRLDFIFVLPSKNSNYKIEIESSKLAFNTPYQGIFLSDHFALNTKLRIYNLK